MINLKEKNRIGSTTCFDLNAPGIHPQLIQITKQEIHAISQVFEITHHDRESGLMQSLPYHGQLFLILNNIEDTNGLDGQSLLENSFVKCTQQIDISFQEINKALLSRMGLLKESNFESTVQKIQLDSLDLTQKPFLKIYTDILKSQVLQRNHKPREALTLLNEVTSTLKQQPDLQFYLFNCLINAADILRQLGSFEDALKDLESAKNLITTLFSASQEETVYYQCVVDINIANIKQDCLELKITEDLLQKCLVNLQKDDIKTAFPSKSNSLAAQVLNNLSTCMHSQGNINQGLQYALKALSLRNEKSSKELAENLINVASFFRDSELLDEALSYAMKGKGMLEQLVIEDSMPYCLGILAAIYLDKGMVKQAKEELMKSKNLQEKKWQQQSNEELATTLHTLGRVNIEEEDWKSAIEYFEKALEMAKNIKHFQIELACLEHLCEAYQGNNENDKAIDILYDAIQLREKSQGEDNGTEELLLDYMNMVVLWEEKGDTDESQYYAKKATELEQKLHSQSTE